MYEIVKYVKDCPKTTQAGPRATDKIQRYLNLLL